MLLDTAEKINRTWRKKSPLSLSFSVLSLKEDEREVRVGGAADIYWDYTTTHASIHLGDNRLLSSQINIVLQLYKDLQTRHMRRICCLMRGYTAQAIWRKTGNVASLRSDLVYRLYIGRAVRRMKSESQNQLRKGESIDVVDRLSSGRNRPRYIAHQWWYIYLSWRRWDWMRCLRTGRHRHCCGCSWFHRRHVHPTRCRSWRRRRTCWSSDWWVERNLSQVGNDLERRLESAENATSHQRSPSNLPEKKIHTCIE